MFTRKPRLQPGKFLNSGAKRLLQHNLPAPEVEPRGPSCFCALPLDRHPALGALQT
jgi:hypothetical protein